MRLRLQIQRQDLPTVNALWPLTNQQIKQPISQLLASINNTFPLETDRWGLEDYVVQVGGYECLHYHEIGNICRDDEEVLIRPLQYAEVRGRTLLGRTQIHSNGMHLVDGVPFGRPLVRSTPTRPTGVRIPPRKRVRINEGSGNEVAEFAYGHGNALEDRIGDGDGHLVALERHGMADDDESDELGRQITWEPRSFDDDDDDGTDDEEDDADFVDEDIEEDSNSTSNISSDEDESDSEDGSCRAEDMSGSGTNSTSTASSSDSNSSSDTSCSEDDTPAPSAEKPAARSSKTQPKIAITTSLPYQGKQETKNRNARRRDSKRLAHLKKEGLLPQDASFEDMKRYDLGELQPRDASHVFKLDTEQATTRGNDASITTDSTSTKTLLNERETVDQQIPVVKKHKLSKQNNQMPGSEEFEKRRKALLNELAQSGVDLREPQAPVSESTEAPEELSSKDPNATTFVNDMAESVVLEQEEAAIVSQKNSTVLVPPSVARRAKLDLAGSKRLLFGSLGVRVPKTQDEKDKLQRKLADRPKTQIDGSKAPRSSEVMAEATQQGIEDGEENGSDPDAWRSKIILRAVECVEEGVNLSTPPFPFYQRWDVQQQRQGKRKKSRSGKYMADDRKRKRNSSADEWYETYDKYNTDGYGDELDYDGIVEDDEYYCDDDDYWEDGALLDCYDGDEQNGNNFTPNYEEDDGFPLLPADISSLPIVHELDAQFGDFIVFTEFTVSAATQWSPASVTRTAQLLSKEQDDSSIEKKRWTIKLALRDMPPRQFDEEGNRIYSKFEMETFTDDEDDEGGDDHERERVVEWTEIEACAPVRLLKRSEIRESEA